MVKLIDIAVANVGDKLEEKECESCNTKIIKFCEFDSFKNQKKASSWKEGNATGKSHLKFESGQFLCSKSGAVLNTRRTGGSTQSGAPSIMDEINKRLSIVEAKLGIMR